MSHYSAVSLQIQNISSKNFLQIDEQRLSQGSEYHVKVRSIPAGNYLQGTWSEWSETVSFYTLPGETTSPVLQLQLPWNYQLRTQGSVLSFRETSSK